jgi:hypothetical protein
MKFPPVVIRRRSRRTSRRPGQGNAFFRLGDKLARRGNTLRSMWFILDGRRPRPRLLWIRQGFTPIIGERRKHWFTP